jgi:hypothetical protein
VDEHLVEGTLVRWSPPWKSLEDAVPLRRDHPGMVISVGPRHILVDWVRRQHTMAENSVYEAEWLTVIDRAEFDRLAREVHELDVAEGGDPAFDDRFEDLGWFRAR